MKCIRFIAKKSVRSFFKNFRPQIEFWLFSFAIHQMKTAKCYLICGHSLTKKFFFCYFYVTSILIITNVILEDTKQLTVSGYVSLNLLPSVYPLSSLRFFCCYRRKKDKFKNYFYLHSVVVVVFLLFFVAA